MRPHLWQPHRLKSDAFDVASNNQIEAAEEKIDASLFSSFFPAERRFRGRESNNRQIDEPNEVCHSSVCHLKHVADDSGRRSGSPFEMKNRPLITDTQHTLGCSTYNNVSSVNRIRH
jgi:hypothetical protein